MFSFADLPNVIYYGECYCDFNIPKSFAHSEVAGKHRIVRRSSDCLGKNSNIPKIRQVETFGSWEELG